VIRGSVVGVFEFFIPFGTQELRKRKPVERAGGVAEKGRGKVSPKFRVRIVSEFLSSRFKRDSRIDGSKNEKHPPRAVLLIRVRAADMITWFWLRRARGRDAAMTTDDRRRFG
jgi:hypothetical protein